MNEQVERWLEEADRDLEVAELLASGGFSDRSVFHSQQAAEKAVKGLFIALHKATPPKTHSVDKLANSVGMPSDLIEGAAHLTADYMPTRYPDVAIAQPFMYTEQIAETRLSEARAIVDWVRRRISDG